MTVAAPVKGVRVDYDVAVPMRDGIGLATDVYRPRTRGRYPAILLRTAYDKGAWRAIAPVSGFDILAAVRTGYAVVMQDVRGLYGSQGAFRFFAEAHDGHDLVAWTARQPWCDGMVGMAGQSYLAAAELQAAATAPPALRALVPALTASEYYEGWVYQGGALNLGFALRWAAGLAYARLLHRRSPTPAEVEQRERLLAVLGDPWAAYRRLPLTDLPREIPALADYGEWLAHPERDEFWRATAINERYDRIAAPALHVAGWNDLFLNGTLENYRGLRDRAANETARAGQRLVVTPWGHLAPTEFVGDVWYGLAASPVGADLHGVHLRFFDEHLKARPAEGAPVRIFVMGANRWRDEEDWPLARARSTRFHLHAGGRLARRPPGDDEPDRYRYDPRDPVPTVGGTTSMVGGGFLMGPRDRRAVEERPDVLVYTSDVLTEDLEVTGPVRATLHVATSAPDTDVVVALVDVHPDGRAIGVTDGILRLRYRSGFDRPQLAEPGRVYEIGVDLAATSMVFLAGHRLRVEVTSSNFPRFDRHPNTGGVIAEAREGDLVVAEQQVHHDPARPSFVTLPTVG